MSWVLNIKPTNIDNTDLKERTDMYKDDILKSLWLNKPNSLIWKIKKSLLDFLKR